MVNSPNAQLAQFPTRSNYFYQLAQFVTNSPNSVTNSPKLVIVFSIA